MDIGHAQRQLRRDDRLPAAADPERARATYGSADLVVEAVQLQLADIGAERAAALERHIDLRQLAAAGFGEHADVGDAADRRAVGDVPVAVYAVMAGFADIDPGARIRHAEADVLDLQQRAGDGHDEAVVERVARTCAAESERADILDRAVADHAGQRGRAVDGQRVAEDIEHRIDDRQVVGVAEILVQPEPGAVRHFDGAEPAGEPRVEVAAAAVEIENAGAGERAGQLAAVIDGQHTGHDIDEPARLRQALVEDGAHAAQGVGAGALLHIAVEGGQVLGRQAAAIQIERGAAGVEYVGRGDHAGIDCHDGAGSIDNRRIQVGRRHAGGVVACVRPVVAIAPGRRAAAR